MDGRVIYMLGILMIVVAVTTAAGMMWMTLERV